MQTPAGAITMTSRPRRRSGWTRRGRTGRVTIVDAAGRPITDETALARVDALRIPPAWRDVWISPSSGARLQATGVDAAGRTQYLYHPRYREARERAKFERLVRFGEHLSTLREAVAEDVELEPLSREWTTGIALTLVNRAWFRPGSEGSARRMRTYGITTLSKRHVVISGHRVAFRFHGKHRVLQQVTLVDASLAAAIRTLLELPGGSRLFRYQGPSGVARLSASQLNAYVRGTMGEEFSVKDFRTWGGTLTAAVALAEHGPPASETEAKRAIAAACRRVGLELGNTPAVARASYISPVVVELFREGRTLESFRPRRDRILSARNRALLPEEAALLRLLRAGGDR
jgi:DNA topoisomerase-1